MKTAILCSRLRDPFAFASGCDALACSDELPHGRARETLQRGVRAWAEERAATHTHAGWISPRQNNPGGSIVLPPPEPGAPLAVDLGCTA